MFSLPSRETSLINSLKWLYKTLQKEDKVFWIWFIKLKNNMKIFSNCNWCIQTASIPVNLKKSQERDEEVLIATTTWPASHRCGPGVWNKLLLPPSTCGPIHLSICSQAPAHIIYKGFYSWLCWQLQQAWPTSSYAPLAPPKLLPLLPRALQLSRRDNAM
jgi:hypothetical protein